MKRFMMAMAAGLLAIGGIAMPDALAGSDRCRETEHVNDPECRDATQEDEDRSGSNSGSDSGSDDDSDNSGSGRGDRRNDDDDDGDDVSSPSPSASPSAGASPSGSASPSVASAASVVRGTSTDPFYAAPAPSAGTVSVVDDDFDPTTYEIAVGGTVTWRQDGDRPHTVTADDGSFDSGMMQPGASFSHRFTKAGTVRYFCSFHGKAGGEGMAGTILVKAGGSAPSNMQVGGPPAVDAGGSDVSAVAGTQSGSLARTGIAIGAILGLAALAIGAGFLLKRAARAR